MGQGCYDRRRSVETVRKTAQLLPYSIVCYRIAGHHSTDCTKAMVSTHCRLRRILSS